MTAFSHALANKCFARLSRLLSSVSPIKNGLFPESPIPALTIRDCLNPPKLREAASLRAVPTSDGSSASSSPRSNLVHGLCHFLGWQCFSRTTLFSRYFPRPLFRSFTRGLATSAAGGGPAKGHSSFRYDELEVQLQPEKFQAPKPDAANIDFGKTFSDHMLECSWTDSTGATFEGMKAYRASDSRILLFRPELNIERLLDSAERLGLPTFDGQEYLRCLKRLISIDREWVPDIPMTALYIRPTYLGPMQPYYTSAKPLSLLADPQYVRAWPGGTGDKKLGCNYAPTLRIHRDAQGLGTQQVLWLFGEDQQITEAGAMSVFVLLQDKNGEPELVTPPLNSLILPGITRRSIAELAREWKKCRVSERRITMFELREASAKGRLLEVFGTGTACIVSPIDRIVHRQKNRSEELHVPTMESKYQVHAQLLQAMLDIQCVIFKALLTIPARHKKAQTGRKVESVHEAVQNRIIGSQSDVCGSADDKVGGKD
ncbi:branched-chain-amino-acid aminotransferase [Tropilaelaps mercedesae]|uniref:Branched-chain-amino-acid aminotransferase n=1 Tax=Tropilaelaps mercedesae TaxID=418985 RepID=A0A1V9XFG8_9ACAR|nr:branched-chain-amino-acid aminotransferase [Tropilaelaps mercedesae]